MWKLNPDTLHHHQRSAMLRPPSCRGFPIYKQSCDLLIVGSICVLCCWPGILTYIGSTSSTCLFCRFIVKTCSEVG